MRYFKYFQFGSTGSGGGVTNYYGSFYSDATQTTLGSTAEVMTFNNTTLSSGVSVVTSGGKASRITVANSGIYNFQFSAQVWKTSGGSKQTLYIWFRKNGVDVPDSNTAITLANNNDLIVASWNFMESMSAGQHLEIVWYATDLHIELYHNPTPSGLPAIPSVILTVDRVG
jgi:hypothetical protein